MANFGIVESPWRQYTFKRIRPQDWDKVIRHIQDYFLRDEPTSKLLGYSDQFGEEFAVLAKKLFQDNLSFWVEHNETGDVAAVRATFRHLKDTSFEDCPKESRTLQYLFKMVDMCNQRCDLFDHFDVDEYADFFVASCAPQYRNQGITSEMYKRSLEFLKAEGFQMAKSVFTSPYTRRAATNLGFDEVGRLYFHEIKDEDGNRLFRKEELNQEHYASLMCKKL